jgi:hypothetical protein
MCFRCCQKKKTKEKTKERKKERKNKNKTRYATVEKLNTSNVRYGL